MLTAHTQERMKPNGLGGWDICSLTCVQHPRNQKMSHS